MQLEYLCRSIETKLLLLLYHSNYQKESIIRLKEYPTTHKRIQNSKHRTSSYQHENMSPEESLAWNVTELFLPDATESIFTTKLQQIVSQVNNLQFSYMTSPWGPALLFWSFLVSVQEFLYAYFKNNNHHSKKFYR